MNDPVDQADDRAEKKFHGWKLLGVILMVVATLALISAGVDLLVIGPMLDRGY